MWPHKKFNLYSHYTASLFVRRTQCMPTGMLHELEDRQTPSFRTGHLVEQRHAANHCKAAHFSFLLPIPCLQPAHSNPNTVAPGSAASVATSPPAKASPAAFPLGTQDHQRQEEGGAELHALPEPQRDLTMPSTCCRAGCGLPSPKLESMEKEESEAVVIWSLCPQPHQLHCV